LSFPLGTTLGGVSVQVIQGLTNVLFARERLMSYGGPERTRISDLYRVKVAL
jgi:hypothetical protein